MAKGEKVILNSNYHIIIVETITSQGQEELAG